MIYTLCYLAVVGITTSMDDHTRHYWAQLNGGHIAELDAEEYDELSEYLRLKNRIEWETVSTMDPNAGMDDKTATELKRKFGHE